jgi:hypothetical protein
MQSVGPVSHHHSGLLQAVVNFNAGYVQSHRVNKSTTKGRVGDEERRDSNIQRCELHDGNNKQQRCCA